MATNPSAGSSTLFDVIGSLEKPAGSSTFFDVIGAQIGVGIPLKQIIIDAPLPLRVYLVSELPDPTQFVNGDHVFVPDETGGSIPAFSDGTDWRRVTDRAIVS